MRNGRPGGEGEVGEGKDAGQSARQTEMVVGYEAKRISCKELACMVRGPESARQRCIETEIDTVRRQRVTVSRWRRQATPVAG